jgi:hypothetical protein
VRGEILVSRLKFTVCRGWMNTCHVVQTPGFDWTIPPPILSSSGQLFYRLLFIQYNSWINWWPSHLWSKCYCGFQLCLKSQLFHQSDFFALSMNSWLLSSVEIWQKIRCISFLPIKTYDFYPSIYRSSILNKRAVQYGNNSMICAGEMQTICESWALLSGIVTELVLRQLCVRDLQKSW